MAPTVIDPVRSPAWSAVSRKYMQVMSSSPESSSSWWANHTVASARRGRIAFHARMSRSCTEFHWSSSGWVSCSQYHWAMELSTRPVGVSALYSSSLAGLIPS